jgi:hypothetical protein
MSFRMEMTRAKSDLAALKQALGRTQLAAGTVRLIVINDLECFDGDEEMLAWRDWPWDGKSCIEIDTA